MTHTAIGLEVILETLEKRFEIDAIGRIVGFKHEGVMPRFVLGRSAEGCVWRFSSRVEPDVVRRIAKLAGREPGFPSDQEFPYPPPERLVMIERILASVAVHESGFAQTGTVHDLVTRDGVMLGEIWSVE
jgi:hypothetical protein